MGMTILEIGESTMSGGLGVNISDTSLFPSPLEDAYKDKTLEITGEVAMSMVGTPELKVSDPSQIKVVE
jgi:hypothetical protein